MYEFARLLVDSDPRPDVVYCDEDHLAANGRTRRAPVFKPAWSPEMLLGYHYTGRLTLARRDLVAAVGGLDLALEEAAEWDLMLRLSERTDRIARITRCLYHNAAAVDVREAARGGPHRRGVLEAHLHRTGTADAIRDRTAQRLVPGLMDAPPHGRWSASSSRRSIAPG